MVFVRKVLVFVLEVIIMLLVGGGGISLAFFVLLEVLDRTWYSFLIFLMSPIPCLILAVLSRNFVLKKLGLWQYKTFSEFPDEIFKRDRKD